jgi:hypothetical protein
MSTRYAIAVNGGPKVGWATTYTDEAAARAAVADANRRDGICAALYVVPSNWTISPCGEIAWLIGGPAGLRYVADVSAPWRE